MPDIPPLPALNRATDEAFAEALAPLFEGAPRFLRRLAGGRPFATWAALFDAARRIAREMPHDEQVELLDAHPRIGASAAEMSDLSRAEQGRGVDDALAGRLEALNERYEQRFGFRYVVFVAGRSREAVVPLLESSLAEDRAAELRRGLDDVVSIARDRLLRLVPGAAAPTIGR